MSEQSEWELTVKMFWASERLREYGTTGNESALDQVTDWLLSLPGGEGESREEWRQRLAGYARDLVSGL